MTISKHHSSFIWLFTTYLFVYCLIAIDFCPVIAQVVHLRWFNIKISSYINIENFKVKHFQKCRIKLNLQMMVFCFISHDILSMPDLILPHSLPGIFVRWFPTFLGCFDPNPWHPPVDGSVLVAKPVLAPRRPVRLVSPMPYQAWCILCCLS